MGDAETLQDATEAPRAPPVAATEGAQRRKQALLAKIADCERRGAILYADAHTLRHQVHDSTSGQWRAVETRLQQLAMSWNPYQDLSAADRAARENAPAAARKERRETEPTAPTAPLSKKGTTKKQDFYALLQIEDRASATGESIKRQFRKLALRLHPDKQQQQQASAAASGGVPADAEARGVDSVVGTTSADAATETDTGETGVDDSTAFARLRVAYETLSDPEQRAAYDAKLEADRGGGGAASAAADGSVLVRNQVQLEASTDFASLEWMARVKHKMDVMDRIAEWAQILGINATEIRFETGEVCTGRQCGKIVSMDRDLECYGSPRRRVYVCLLHKYIHACDEVCTSWYGDAELDKRVCPMRAYWLIQNWLFDQLQQAAAASHALEEEKEAEEQKREDAGAGATPPLFEPCKLDAAEIHLGDGATTFRIANASTCRSATCSGQFQYLDEGIYACRVHGTPHVCTYEQCEAKELRNGRYVCWSSGQLYGEYREEAGTGTRTRQIVYTDAHGEAAAIEMEVPVLLPLGKMTSYLLEGGDARARGDDVSSLSPPPPGEKAWRSRDGGGADERSPRPMLKRRTSDRETSPVRARIRRRLSAKVQQAEVSSFYVHLKLPAAVANLPRVALELQDPGAPEDPAAGEHRAEKLLPIRVRAKDTVNYIKFWMEELTDQQISLWDQQLLWGDTVIGDEGNVMVLEEHGIIDGCVLELRLHDDCPLLVSTWNGGSAASGGTSGGGAAATAEYNTVLISKEAEEDLEDLHDEWENVIAVEEEAFARSRLKRKREKLEDTGALNHTEVIQYDGNVARLVGVVPGTRDGVASRGLLTHSAEHAGVFVPEARPRSASSKQEQALRDISSAAKAVIKQ
ncbi:hypothetical protein PybrP1_000027 [[Pythium] brassicae (nom. inval.)]|nr:hypothetical protein PybrP1_000027 [[Pythium] brassicae (nom. inval.)]